MGEETSSVDYGEKEEGEDWLSDLQTAVGTYVLPSLTGVGVFFNCASIVVLHHSEVRLRRSLVLLFTFLNTFDSVFLICTFLVFGLPNLSPSYHLHASPHLIPYLVPILQTCLTISVYSTVAIAVTCILIVNPPTDEGDPRSWVKLSCKVNVAAVGCAIVFVASAMFNLSRWFEYSTVPAAEVVVSAAATTSAVEKEEEGTEPEVSAVVVSSNETARYVFVMTELRENASYVQYYSLIGSGIVMVFVPFLALLVACACIGRSMVAGTQKKKTLRIMTIIIVMFLVCHSPKVILTVYEVCYDLPEDDDGGGGGGRASSADWSTWALILKEVSQVLLVSYSAFNPLAYCGDLVLRKACCCRRAWKKVGGGQGGRGVPPQCCCCCSRKQLSEIEMMESVGVTMRGGDSIQQQLAELDPQSRILSGLKPLQHK